jgi:hypothetical protein
LTLTRTVFVLTPRVLQSLPPCLFTPNFEPAVPLTAALRPAKVPWGNSRMASSGQSNRSQFQIGNTCVSPAGVGRAGMNLSRAKPRGPRRKRRHDAHTACASSLAQGLCLLGTGGANAQQAGLPVPPKVASKHLPLAGPVPAERATAFSNRYTARVECPLTHSKLTSLVLSNRYKKPPPGGVLLCNHFALFRPPRPHRPSRPFHFCCAATFTGFPQKIVSPIPFAIY